MNYLSLRCRAVANYILEEVNKFNNGKSNQEKVIMTTKRLQKLLYFCEAEYMKKNKGIPLFEDEFYAWPSGPVIPELYHEFMQYYDSDMYPIYEKNEKLLSNDIKLIINQILVATNDLDTIDLTNIINTTDSPYSKVFNEEDEEHKQIVSKKDTYLYYLNKELMSQFKPEELNIDLYQDEIIKLKDKDLQLRYILSGLYPHGALNCKVYWGCDIRCSTRPVPIDLKYKGVKDFISKHNISNSTFLKLARSYLFGAFNSYNGDWGTLIPELHRAISEYNFAHDTSQCFPENDLKEQELLELIEREANVPGTNLNNFLTKYSLTPVDFVILAKTSINYKFKLTRGFEPTDLRLDLKQILSSNNIYETREYVEKYRENPPKQNVKKIGLFKKRN